MSQIILTKVKKNRNRKNTELKEITKLKENDNCTENMVAKESDSCLSMDIKLILVDRLTMGRLVADIQMQMG